MKRNLLVGLRLDSPKLSEALADRFDLVPFPRSTPASLQDFHVPSLPFMGIELSAWVARNWNPVTAAIAKTHQLIDQYKPAGAVLWNTCQPQMAAVALTCKSRGVPVFEITHWAIATYWIGHFEDTSLADYVFCSPEHWQFAQRVGHQLSEYIPLGRPQWDHWKREDRHEARARMGLPTDGPYVLVTSTWDHTLSEWSNPDWNLAHQTDIIRVLQYFKKAMPGLGILWSTRGLDSAERVGQRLGAAGLDVFATDDEPIQDLINAADVVVTQKSGVIADACVLRRPVVCVDYHPNNDSWAWRKYGAIHAPSLTFLARSLSRLLRSPDLGAAYCARQGTRADAWFGWKDGQASRAIAERIGEICTTR